jgi:calcium-dependent protein kinase
MECPARLACHEAEILRRLDHPNVIRILEVFEEKKAVHLVLELCEGGDVLERILVSSGRLPEADIATLFIQMLFAVWHLHQNGVVHRDLKPEHFLFTRREPEFEPRPPQRCSMKLIDFGLSHKAGAQFAPEGGTPQFMSPEAKSGRAGKEFSDRGDMWSLGVVLHAMLVGHYPSQHLTDAKQAQYFGRPAWSAISKAAIDLLRQLLQQQPAARPSAANALMHTWSKATISRTVLPPEPLLKGAASAVKVYTSTTSLRRLALAAVAREAADADIIGLRQVLQALELLCDGKLARRSLLKAASTEGSVGEVASTLFRTFDSLVENGGILNWTEFIAVFMSVPASNAAAGHCVPIRDEACWRAFDLLSQGTGFVSGMALELFVTRPRGNGSDLTSEKLATNGNRNGRSSPRESNGNSGDNPAELTIDSALREVSASGTIEFHEFMCLARGLLHGKARRFSLMSSLGRMCGQKPAKHASAPLPSPPPSNERPAIGKLATPPSSPPCSPRVPSSPAASATLSNSQSPTSTSKKKKRVPLSILEQTSL